MTASTASVLAELRELQERYRPQPLRWMVRRDGLSAELNAMLDLLDLPERKEPAYLLPSYAIAIVFEEEPGNHFPKTFAKILVIRDPEEQAPRAAPEDWP